MSVFNRVSGLDFNIGNVTVGSTFLVSINLTPRIETGTNAEFFVFDVFIDGVDVDGDPDTRSIGDIGNNIGRVEIFTEGIGSFTLGAMRLIVRNDDKPSFVQFENGEVTTILDITITDLAPIPEIAGDGFTIITDFNKRFFSRCQYEDAGTVVQRHYIAPKNTIDDYTNFRDLVVDLPTPFFTDELLVEEDRRVATNIDNFIRGLGVPSSPSVKFFAWAIIMFFVIFPAFMINPFLGAIAVPILLIMGAFFGLVPLWVVILLGIFGGFIVVLLFRQFGASGV